MVSVTEVLMSRGTQRPNKKEKQERNFEEEKEKNNRRKRKDGKNETYERNIRFIICAVCEL